MSVSGYTDEKWIAANQRFLMQAIAKIRASLQSKLHDTPEEETTLKSETPSALELLCKAFDLSSFERDILLLCAGMELDGSWGSLCAEVQGNPQRNYPTFSLALAVFSAAHWDALTPTATLRQWRLIEVGVGNALTNSPLRIDERILHYLAGIPHLDERLLGIVEQVPVADYLVPSHEQIVGQLTDTWLQASSQLPVVQLCGEDVVSKRAIASVACAKFNLRLHALAADVLPGELSQLNLIKSLCEREYILSNTALLLECDDIETVEQGKEVPGYTRLIESINCPLIVSSRERYRQKQRPLITFEVHHPTTDEQRGIWENALGEFAPILNGQVETLVSHFTLSASAIQSACLKVKTLERGGDEDSQLMLQNHLWDVCRTQARPRLDALAQRIDLAASWDDLILPEKERSVLRDVAAHVRQRTKVYETWGFAGKSKRGLGISALFSGASGTGKTMAAEVLANELRLDVYRIDLSSIVSKYIGETEKNLRRVFDAAEGAGAILLFDEADALFGKRSEVKDSHDRHANIEVSYLLQRMESYRGLAILTTNLKGSIDQAFLRRIRFVVQFPFPDVTQRAEIWRRVFPKQTPVQELDHNKLAKLNVAGGNIRNIALNAAFLAADAGESVEMKHILEAAKSEYMKLERPLTDIEVKGWV